MSIRVENLTKIYGEQRALDAISFEASKGEILGFLGPNGAGKSTTMKILTGYLPATSGNAYVCNMDVNASPLAVKQRIGYLPEHNPLYLDMYVREFLTFIGRVYKLSSNTLKSQINELIERCGLEREQGKKIGALSKGYRQRVGLAQSLIHDPEVLVLDEPTTGLDPNQIIEIRELIRHISTDKTVIFSSHIMQEVQALCDRVVIIDKGKIVANDKIDRLKASKVEVAIYAIEFDKAIETTILKSINGIIEVIHLEGGKYQLKATTESDIRPALFDLAARSDFKLLGLSREEVTMENVFKKLTGGKT